MHAGVTEESSILRHDWMDLVSKTGTYTFWANMYFSLLSGKKESMEVVLDWTQACHIDITDLAIVSFTEADYDLSSEAYATLFAKGTVAGDCGADQKLTGYLDELDSEGTDYPLSLDLTEFLSAEGTTVSVDVHRDAREYALSL